MSTPMSIAVFFTIWWIVLFAILPIGVKSQHEAGVTDIPPGADPGAPVAPCWCARRCGRLSCRRCFSPRSTPICFGPADP